MTFEERFSNLFQRGKRTQAAAKAAAAGQSMPPIGGNRLTNFLAFPPGTDPTVNQRGVGLVQRGVYRLPSTLQTVINNNSPIPLVSAKPSGSMGPGVGARVRAAEPPRRAVARGTPAFGLSRMNRARLAWDHARTRVRGALGG
jgi:hypothetical protein